MDVSRTVVGWIIFLVVLIPLGMLAGYGGFWAALIVPAGGYCLGRFDAAFQAAGANTKEDG